MPRKPESILFTDEPKTAMDPSEAAVQTLSILGAKGSGKTYGATRAVEALYDAGCPFLVIDPVGNWSYLRLAADGKSEGLPILIVGGDRGDMPLVEEQMTALGAWLVEHRQSAVVDVSLVSKASRKRIAADLLESVFDHSKKAREPRQLILEECQLLIPQFVGRGDERLVGIVTEYVRIGRNYSLGVVLLSQRPQSVNKEVLNMVECLFVGQMRGAQERKAIREWVVEQDADLAKEVNQLPKLEVGQFYCWSPSWLRFFGKVRFLPKRTYDGSSTRRLGALKGRSQLPLPKVDLGELEAFLASHSEGEKKESRAAVASPAPGPVEPVVPLAEVESIIEENVRPWRERVGRLRAELDVEVRQTQGALGRVEVLERYVLRVAAAARELAERVAEVPPPWKPEPRPGKAELDQAALAQLPKAEKPQLLPAGPAPRPLKERAPLVAGAIERRNDPLFEGMGQREMNGAAKLKVNAEYGKKRRADLESSDIETPTGLLENKVQQEVVNVLAAYGAMSRLEVALVSGMSPKSSSLDLAIAALVRTGHVIRSSKGLSASAAGIAVAQRPSHSFGESLRSLWQSKMSSGDWQMLLAVARAGRLPRVKLPEALGRPGSKSSSIDLGVSRLKKSGILVAGGGQLWLSDGAKRAFGFR